MGDVRTPYQKWQDTIKLSKTDVRWHSYDTDIKAAVKEFDTFLANTPGYIPLSWKLIKAMVWTESGGPISAAWNQRPMQIGNAGDPGFGALLSGQEGGELIMPEALAIQLTTASVNQPKLNIRAGIAYLLMRAASYETVSIEDADKTVTEYTVKPGDNLSAIASREHTTLAMLKKLNPEAEKSLMPGQKLSIRKAAMKKRIKGWAVIGVQFAATKYNIGDKLYAQKLNYCLTFIP